MSRENSGGFVHRMMPPIDWDFGEIPDAALKTTDRREIRALLEEAYLREENLNRLVEAGEANDLSHASLLTQFVAEIDASTLWAINISRET